MSKNLKNIISIFNAYSALIIALTLLSTWACLYFEIKANLPFELFLVAIFFPLAITIYSAYERRDSAIERLSDFKSSCIAIYSASKDWPKIKDEKLLADIKKSLTLLYTNISTYLYSGKVDTLKYEIEIHKQFSEISNFLKKVDQNDLDDEQSARLNLFFEKQILSFFELKNLFIYGSPGTLRGLVYVSTFILPVFYGPFFANMIGDPDRYYGYLFPFFIALIVTSLNNVQAQLEDPYDQIGPDDLHFDVESFSQLMR